MSTPEYSPSRPNPGTNTDPFSLYTEGVFQFPTRHSFPGGEVLRQQSPLQAGVVDFEALYELGDTFLQPVPEDERAKYRYWRGASLAKIAMNISRGVTNLNAGQATLAHFTESYEGALYSAHEHRVTQFNTSDRLELATFTGHDPASPLPRIVFALDESFNTTQLPSSGYGKGHGVVHYGQLTLDMIDEHSRTVIENLKLK